MAFSAVTERGSVGNKSAGTTLAGSPSANLTVGKIVFVLAVADNTATTAGASTTHTSVADTDLNTWNKVFERTQTAGVAADGVTTSLWWTKVATQIDTGDSITLTLTSCTSKAIGFFEATVGAGNTIALADGTATAHTETNIQDPGAISTSGMTSEEHLHLGIVGKEDEGLVWTEDANFTNVYAAEGFGNGIAGAADTNVAAFVASRISTSTGETFNPGAIAGGARDICQALVAFREDTGAAPTADPYPYVGGGYYPVEG